MKIEAWRYLTQAWDRHDSEQRRIEEAAGVFFDAVARNDWMAASKLIERGCSSNMLLGQRTPLMVAAEYGALETAKLLIATGASLGSQDEIGRDSLTHAVENAQDALVDLLLEKGAPIKRTFQDNATALIQAAKFSNVHAVRSLVKYDKNMVDMYDRLGRTALWHVLSKESLSEDDNEIARILIDSGADPSAVDFEGVSPKEAARSEAAQSLAERAELARGLENDEAAPEPASAPTKRRKHGL